jgi:hypothetical protein
MDERRLRDARVADPSSHVDLDIGARLEPLGRRQVRECDPVLDGG